MNNIYLFFMLRIRKLYIKIYNNLIYIDFIKIIICFDSIILFSLIWVILIFFFLEYMGW